MAVDGHRFWAQLKLRSTLFTLRTEVAEPPVEGEALGARVPDLQQFAGTPGEPAVTGAPAVAGTRPERAPWVLLAVILLAISGSATRRARARAVVPAAAADTATATDEPEVAAAADGPSAAVVDDEPDAGEPEGERQVADST